MGRVISNGDITLIHENGEQITYPAGAFAFESEPGLGPGGGSGNKRIYTYQQEVDFESGDRAELIVEVREINNGFNGKSIDVTPLTGDFEIKVDESELKLDIEPT